MKKSGTILIIDDNPDDIYLTTAAIVDGGDQRTIEPVFDGQQALARLAEEPLPALVFLDIKMPGMGGIDILINLRAKDASRYIPVVMLSASDLEHDIKASYDGGANSFLHKAYDPKTFTEGIQTAVRYWIEHNRTP